MNLGDTFFGLDRRGHLWAILSEPDNEGLVAVANFTTHDPEHRQTCSNDCVEVRQGEHDYPSHDSCIYYRGARLEVQRRIRDAVASKKFEQGAPLGASLLLRIQQGALDSMYTRPEVEQAIRRALS